MNHADSEWDRPDGQRPAVVGLQDGDSYMVLETCGYLSAIPRFPEGGKAFTVINSGTSAIWPVITAPGRAYRLCWCAAGYKCDEVMEFRVDAGTMHIAGPEMEQFRTCVSGRLCSLDNIRGHMLQPGDHWVVLDTCGVNKGKQMEVLGKDDGYSGPVGVCTIGTTSSSSSIVAVTDDSAVGSEPR